MTLEPAPTGIGVAVSGSYPFEVWDGKPDFVAAIRARPLCRLGANAAAACARGAAQCAAARDRRGWRPRYRGGARVGAAVAADDARDLQGHHRRPRLRLSAAVRAAPCRRQLRAGSECPDGPGRSRASRSSPARRAGKPFDDVSPRRAGSLVALVCLAGGAALLAQPNVEDQAPPPVRSGLEFYRAGRYAEAIKDFQTVAEGYPTSTVADDALLAVAEYQLDIARDPIAARSTADTLIKKYATGDSAPMGYVVIGRATLEIDQTPAGLDSALASFDRVPRLFPKSEATAPALYYGAEVDRRADRPANALDRLQRLALEFPRSVWAARSRLLESRLLVAADSRARRCERCSALSAAFRRVTRRRRRAPGTRSCTASTCGHRQGPRSFPRDNRLQDRAAGCAMSKRWRWRRMANWPSRRAPGSSCSTRRGRFHARHRRTSRASCSSIGRTG